MVCAIKAPIRQGFQSRYLSYIQIVTFIPTLGSTPFHDFCELCIAPVGQVNDEIQKIGLTVESFNSVFQGSTCYGVPSLRSGDASRANR